MALSKKHYEQFAQCIKTQRDKVVRICGDKSEGNTTANVAINTLEDLAISMAAHFALDNERFDEQRFLKACGF